MVMPPLLFSLIFFLPQAHHLAFCLFVVVIDAIASYEMQLMLFPKHQRKMLDKDGNEVKDMPLIPFWVPCLIPLMQYFDAILFPMREMTEFTLMLLIIIAFALEVNKGSKDAVPFSGSLHRMSHTAMLIIYPSYLSMYFIKLAVVEEEPSLLLILLFLLVFGNDIFCYVFGMLFGKSTRGIVAVSPNKSIVGYIGGSVMTMIFGGLYMLLIPAMQAYFTVLDGVLIGLLISFTSDVGDLIESAFKRAAGVKDSGSIIPGRGGMLDSVDSLLASVPFFYLLTMEILK